MDNTKKPISKGVDASASDKKIAESIKSRFSTLSSNQAPIFDKVEQYKAMYHVSMETDDSYPWDYQLTDSQIFPAIRAHLARMNPSEARISLIGAGENREVNQQVVNWEMNEILITQLMYRLMYSGFMAGHGYAKTGWFFKPALKVEADKGSKLMRGIQNRADAVFVRFNDLFIPNRNIPEIDAQPYIIERVSMRYGDLLDDQKSTKRWKQDLIKKIGTKKQFVNTVSYGVDLINEDAEKEDQLLRSQYVSLLCMYTADAKEYWVVEKGDDDILNIDTDNRYWHGHYPYLDFAPFPEDDEFFSMGIPHTIADLEIALSSTLNQLLTNGRKAGNSMWLVGESGKQVPDWMFTDRPNGIVRVKGQLNDYQRLDFNTSASRETLQLRQELKTTSETVSGISSLYSSGVASSPNVNKTATGAQIIDNNIDQNLQLLISLFGAQILKKMGEHFLELNQQYITEEQTIEVTGKNGNYDYIKVTPDQISADFKVKASPEGLLKASPAVKLASLQNTIMTLEASKSIKSDTKPLYEELIRQTPGFEDIDADSIIIDPEKKSMEVVKAIVEGFEPPKATWDDDFKPMIAIIQKDMIEHPEYTPEQLMVFKTYIDDLNRWIQAKNPNLLQVGQGQAVGAQPTMNPTDPASLAQSMASQIQPQQNPTANLPVQMSQDQMGGGQ
jgi:hypothetical protein